MGMTTICRFEHQPKHVENPMINPWDEYQFLTIFVPQQQQQQNEKNRPKRKTHVPNPFETIRPNHLLGPHF
jgi:hypothetical protein